LIFNKPKYIDEILSHYESVERFCMLKLFLTSALGMSLIGIITLLFVSTITFGVLWWRERRQKLVRLHSGFKIESLVVLK
jgi:uncharacterized SAM-binding protein YcdF (DUF218 family)